MFWGSAGVGLMCGVVDWCLLFDCGVWFISFRFAMFTCSGC